MMSLSPIGLPVERMLMASRKTFSLSQQVRIARAFTHENNVSPFY